MTSPDVRRLQFADWVTHVTDRLRADNRWTMRQLIAQSGVGKDAIYAWKRGDWSEGPPKPAKVADFCDHLGLDVAEPFRILGLIRTRKPRPAAQPPQSERLRKLVAIREQDPNLTEQQRIAIDAQIDYIIANFGGTGERGQPGQGRDDGDERTAG